MSQLNVATVAEQPREGPHRERRASPRHPSGREASCRALAARGDESWPATILDISMGGIGLALRRRFERGALLGIELVETGEAPHHLMARVVHVSPLGGNRWQLGCALLSPLTEDEVAALLRRDVG